MKFEEASKMKEGTLFNVICKNKGSGWLNCYFKNGIVYNGVGNKLAASLGVFNADWKECVEEDNWDWYEKGSSGEARDLIGLLTSIKKLKGKLLDDIDKLPYQEILTTEFVVRDRVKEIINKRFGI